MSNWFCAISEYLPAVEHEALDQLEKAQRFVVAWLTARPTRGPDAPRLIRFVGFATVFFDTDSDVSMRAEEEASGADASTSEAIPGVDKCSLRVAGFIEPAARPATPLPN